MARIVCFVLEVGECALGDVDESAGRGTRVHGIGIEHDERPRENPRR